MCLIELFGFGLFIIAFIVLYMVIGMNDLWWIVLVIYGIIALVIVIPLLTKKKEKKKLEEDSLSEEQAEYAAKNCGVDWNEQAVRAAKEWLEYEPLSRKKLIEYLIDDGFTPEQAEYAANAIESKK